MKKRGGFDSGKIKRFFVQHLEKIALGLVGICFLLFVYSAATQESFSGKTPQEITEEANSAQLYVDQSAWDPTLAAIEQRDLSAAVELSRKPIPKVPFELTTVMMPRPRTTTLKRPQPDLLAVIEPRAVLETGLFAIKGPNWGKAQLNMGMGGEMMPGGGMGATGSPDGGPGPRRGKNKQRPRPGAGGPGMPGDATMPGEGMMDPGMMGGGYGMATGMPPGSVQPPMGADLKGVRFVAITGLVPYADQFANYAEAFDEASWKSVTPYQQYPFYTWYAVERAEVTDQSDPSNLTWTSLDVIGTYREAILKWAAAAPEVVAAYNIDQRLCFPLGPLVDRQWDKAVAHSPAIPLASNVMSMAAINPAMIQDPKSAGLIDKDNDGVPDFTMPDMTGMGGGAAMGGYGGGMPGGGMMPGSDGGGEAMGGMSFPGLGGMGGGMGGLPGFPGMNMGMPGGSDMSGMGGYGMGGGYGEAGYDPYGTGQMQSSPYRLFRFFDFTVQEGKRYRYRVKLMLLNPNYELDARFVVDSKATKLKRIETPWSDPTPEVHVRAASTLLAGKVEPSRGTREAKATVMVRHWDPADGSSAFKEFPLELGQLANFAGKNVDRYDWKTYSNQPVPSVDFKTDLMLVDVRGGEQLDSSDKDFSEPGEMLFMGPDGRLIVRTELDDWDRYSNDQQALEVLKNPNPVMGGMMPGEGGYDTGGEAAPGARGGKQRPRPMP